MPSPFERRAPLLQCGALADYTDDDLLTRHVVAIWKKRRRAAFVGGGR